MRLGKKILIVNLSLIIALILLLVIAISIFLNTDKGKSFYRIYNLKPDRLQSYFDSYDDLYDPQNLKFSDRDDYKNNRPPKKFIDADNNCDSSINQYNILNDLCNLGNIKKMYIPPELDSNKSLRENQILLEQNIAKKLKVEPGGKILDIGCGCGRIADHISELTQCHIFGINFDQKQVIDAQKYAQKKKSNNKFILHDLNNKLPFSDNYFDSIYTVQGLLSFMKEPDKVFKEIFRVLKPGGYFFIFDLVLMDNYNGQDPHHRKLLNNSRMVMAAGYGYENYYKYYDDYLEKTGFKILDSSTGNPEEPNKVSDLSQLRKEHDNYQKIEDRIKLLEKCRILPKHMVNLIDKLRFGAEELIEMMDNDMLTMGWQFYCQKPIK